MLYSLVKTATDERGDLLLEREARWLRELEGVSELEGMLPRLLDEGTDARGHRYLVMTIAQGTGETRAFTGEHARFLASLGKTRFRATDFELSGCGEWLSRSLDEVERFAAPPATDALHEAYRDCETALLYWTGPYVLSQGDFAPWNIRTFGAQLFVYEWGQARTNASPLDDVLHYLMVQRALSRGPVSAPFLQEAMKSAQRFAVQAYPEWSWRPRVIGALTLVYLLGAILQRSLANRCLDRDDLLVGAYWRLIEERSGWMPE